MRGVVLVGVALTTLAGSALAASVTVHQAGYSYSPFVTTSVADPDDLELDLSGNIYLLEPGDVRLITPAGVASAWSSAPARDIAFAEAGDAYAAGATECDCVLSVTGNGAYSTLHADSQEWKHVALGSDGVLYAAIYAGSGKGLYTIDRTTGVPTVQVSGGPGPAGAGFYRSMMIGLDGKLYAAGSSGVTYGLFRLDGGQFTQVATWPHGGYGLAQDDQGVFYTSVPILSPFGTSLNHEVWKYDPNAGTVELLAEGAGTSVAVAYDRARDLLYVQNASDVYIIAKSPTPASRATWGQVKSLCR